MQRCKYADDCAFFQTSTGYSPELYQQMRSRYCLGEQDECYRLMARELVGKENVPNGMMPTDIEIWERIRIESGDGGS